MAPFYSLLDWNGTVLYYWDYMCQYPFELASYKGGQTKSMPKRFLWPLKCGIVYCACSCSSVALFCFISRIIESPNDLQYHNWFTIPLKFPNSNFLSAGESKPRASSDRFCLLCLLLSLKSNFLIYQHLHTNTPPAESF